MLTVFGGGAKYCDGLTRRSFLTIGGLAMGGMSLPNILRESGHRYPLKACNRRGTILD